MSLFGRALAGAGEAAARIGNRYIEQEMDLEKMQALEDLRFNTAKRISEYELSPEVTARRADAESAIGRARNTVVLEGQRAVAGDAQLQSSLRSNAAAALATETEALMARAKQMLPLEIKRAAAIAAAGRAPEKDPADLIAKIEKAVGRPLTEVERLGVMGLGAKVSKESKYDFEEVTTESVDPKTGAVTKRTRYVPLGAVTAAPTTPESAMAQVRARVAEARDKGSLDDAIKELRGMRLTDAQLLDVGIKPEELRPKPAAPVKVDAPKDPLAMMSIRDLQRIASIEGHVNRKAAQARLDELRAQRADESSLGFGYR
jgi:hypothetical protein